MIKKQAKKLGLEQYLPRFSDPEWQAVLIYLEWQLKCSKRCLAASRRAEKTTPCKMTTHHRKWCENRVSALQQAISHAHQFWVTAKRRKDLSEPVRTAADVIARN